MAAPSCEGVARPATARGVRRHPDLAESLSEKVPYSFACSEMLRFRPEVKPEHFRACGEAIQAKGRTRRPDGLCRKWVYSVGSPPLQHLSQELQRRGFTVDRLGCPGLYRGQLLDVPVDQHAGGFGQILLLVEIHAAELFERPA
jgi:hypothetical protein